MQENKKYNYYRIIFINKVMWRVYRGRENVFIEIG
jgi:hypothetical protein